MDQSPAMLGSEKPDVVIVVIGANDAQSFVVDGKVLLFGSEEWNKTYQLRVANFRFPSNVPNPQHKASQTGSDKFDARIGIRR